MSTITAVITSRNDNYGENLKLRALYSIQNFIERYDEIIYVDWNSENNSLLDEIKSKLFFKNNLIHIKVKSEDIYKINKDLLSIPIIDVLGRNIGIRRANSDFIVSTNIDIIASKPNLDLLDKDTLYTTARRNIENFDNDPILFGNNLIKNINNYNSFPDIDDINDKWSLVVACGDYQLAHKSLWNKIKGFEEEMIYRCFADSNLMKKGSIYGKISKLDLPVFHLNHNYSHQDIKNKVIQLNDKNKYIQDFIKTNNSDNWGFNNFNFESEIL